MDKSIYYNPNRLMSFDRLMNFVIGARGIGKTYGFKKHVINNFIKRGEKFIYLRRYREEIKKVNKFFDSVITEFPGHTFEVKGRTFLIDDEVAGYAIPLSSWQSEKSNEYPDVTYILFDEFIRQKDMSGYMPNEVEAFLNFVDTVVRNRDNVRVVCMSNATTITNPYFTYFKITPNLNKEFTVKGELVIQTPDSRDFKTERLKTRFGKLISNTNYADMSMDNEFTEDSAVFIEKRSANAKFKFSITYLGKTYGVWLDENAGLMILSHAHDPSTRFNYTLKKTDMDVGNMYVKNFNKNYHIRNFAEFFKLGALRFESQQLKNIGYDMLNDMRVQ